ncbi:MAG: hypothetical protein ACFFCZ_06450 [Promethearchaeota archaeon]
MKINPSTLSSFADFLRIRGRFKDIQVDERDRQIIVTAEPLFPEQPSLTAYTTPGHDSLILEIRGTNIDFLKDESLSFFFNEDLELIENSVIFSLPNDQIEIMVRGSDSLAYEETRRIIYEVLRNSERDPIIPRTMCRFIRKKVVDASEESDRHIRPVVDSHVSNAPSRIMKRSIKLTKLKHEPQTFVQASSLRQEASKSSQENLLVLSNEERVVIRALLARHNHKAQSNLLVKPTKLDQETLRNTLKNLVKKGLLTVNAGWYILNETALRSVDDPQLEFELKKDKEEKQLTQLESLVLDAILERPKKKAQTNFLAKTMSIEVDKLKEALRSLVDKQYLEVSYGWYVAKSKHELEAQNKSQNGTTNTKSSFELSGTELEVLRVLKNRPGHKIQSNVLANLLNSDKEKVKFVLRKLVKDGILTVNYGWYVLKPSKLDII